MESGEMAIPLILYQEREGFRVTQEAIDFLSSVTGKVAVVAVAGKYRTGKSYILNRVILNRIGGGFSVGPTINPCTKGLWIWNQAIPFTTSDGDKVNLLIVDTEGIGAFDEDQNHDTRIFMLAVLLSSYFIYNSVGNIDENALNNINLVVNLTKNLQVRSSDSQLDVDEIQEYFPSFLWLIRDFSLQLVDQSGNPITSREYLENALQMQKGVSDSIEAKNRVRKLIKHFFRDRDCFVMIRPTERDSDLHSLNEMNDRELRPEFLRQLENLRKLINRKVKTKMMNGQPMTGEMLKVVMQSYVDAINGGRVPTIEGAWKSMCESEAQKNIETTTKEYEDSLKNSIPGKVISPKELKALHKQFKQNAIKNFKQKSIGDGVEVYEEMLLKAIDDRFNMLSVQNSRKIENQCKDLCEALQTEMTDLLKQGEYTDFSMFKKDFEAKAKEYLAKGADPETASAKIKELSATLLAEGAEYISRNAIIEHKNESRRLQQQLDFHKAKLDSKKSDFQQEKESLSKRISELESENYMLKGTKMSLEMRIEELRKDKDRADEKYTEQMEHIRSTYKDQAGFKEKYENLLETHNALLREQSTENNNLQKKLALAEQEIQWKERESTDFRDKYKSLEANFRENKAQLRLAREELEASHRELNSLKDGNSLKSEREWQNEKRQLESQVDSLKSQVEESRSVQERLISALQNKRPELVHAENTEATKHLTIALQRLEDKTEEQEQKIEHLKKFQKMVQHSSALQCKLCGKKVSSNIFSAHVTVCLRDSAK